MPTVFVEPPDGFNQNSNILLFNSGIKAEIAGSFTAANTSDVHQIRDEDFYLINLNPHFSGDVQVKLQLNGLPPATAVNPVFGAEGHIFVTGRIAGGFFSIAQADFNLNSGTDSVFVNMPTRFWLTGTEGAIDGLEIQLIVNGFYTQPVTPPTYNVVINGGSDTAPPPPPPPLPDIAMGAESISADGKSVSATYSITGNDLPGLSTIGFYWATGPSFANRIGTSPATVATAMAASSIQYTAIAAISRLGPRPANATHILAVADSPDVAPGNNPNGLILESNEDDNISAVLAPSAPIADVGLDSINISYFNADQGTSSTVNFSYHTVGSPATFTAALYQSADLNFDPSDTLVTSHVVTPAPNSSWADGFTVNFTPLPSRPYLLVVINPQNFVPQSNGNVHELPAYLVSVSQLQAIMPTLPLSDALRYIGPLNEAMEEFNINTPKREAAFLSQLAWESSILNKWEELWTSRPDFRLRTDRPPHTATSKQDYFNYWYSGVGGNGDYNSNDGYNYRGQGPIQLTGRSNYAAAGAALGLDLIDNPDLVSDKVNNPLVGLRVAAWYFATRRLALSTSAGQALVARSSLPRSILSSSMLVIADAVDNNNYQSIYDVNEAITYGINGGFRNERQRLTYYVQALSVLAR